MDRGEFEEYRRQQLKLTKKGMLPPKMAAVDVTDEAGDEQHATKPKPKAKIEIVRNSAA